MFLTSLIRFFFLYSMLRDTRLVVVYECSHRVMHLMLSVMSGKPGPVQLPSTNRQVTIMVL